LVLVAGTGRNRAKSHRACSAYGAPVRSVSLSILMRLNRRNAPTVDRLGGVSTNTRTASCTSRSLKKGLCKQRVRSDAFAVSSFLGHLLQRLKQDHPAYQPFSG